MHRSIYVKLLIHKSTCIYVEILMHRSICVKILMQSIYMCKDTNAIDLYM